MHSIALQCTIHKLMHPPATPVFPDPLFPPLLYVTIYFSKNPGKPDSNKRVLAYSEGPRIKLLHTVECPGKKWLSVVRNVVVTGVQSSGRGEVSSSQTERLCLIRLDQCVMALWNPWQHVWHFIC